MKPQKSEYWGYLMLALRSERFARSVKESLTIQKCQVEFFVAMPVNMDIRANLTLTFLVYLSGGDFETLACRIAPKFN